MEELRLSVGEPFSSPAWDSNFVVFTSKTGAPILEEDAPKYIQKACRYALKYETYLVPERFMALGNQSMCLIGPDGKVIGAQQAIFENPAFPVTQRGIQIDTWETPFGKIYLSVDVDIYRPEVAKVAYNLGARLIISSQYISAEEYSSQRIVSGVWSAAQSNRVITIGVSNQFHCVAAPKEMTKHQDGFLVAPTMRMPMVSKISVDQVDQLKLRPPLSRHLYAIHRQNLLDATTEVETDD